MNRGTCHQRQYNTDTNRCEYKAPQDIKEYEAIQGDLTLGREHTVQYGDDVLTEALTYIILLTMSPQ